MTDKDEALLKLAQQMEWYGGPMAKAWCTALREIAIDKIKPWPIAVISLETSNYECEAGALVNDRSWQAVKKMLGEM